MSRKDLQHGAGRLRPRSTIPPGSHPSRHRTTCPGAPNKSVGSGRGEYWARFGDLDSGLQQLDTRAHKQLGTLGGTPEMDAYRNDLTWTQKYAARNRRVMLELVCAAVRDSSRLVLWCSTIRSPATTITWQPSRSMDSSSLSPVRARSVRAWATWTGSRARWVPDRTWCGGLGSTESFYSASHGAGRKMSLTKARKTFTAKDLVAQTQGVESRKDAVAVDEIRRQHTRTSIR